MRTEVFLRPRLTGVRFEGHAIPLEFLKDLAVLQEMIVEVAKLEFIKDHPGRKRSPRGFTDGIELKLTGIEDGSAVPVIWLFIAASSLFPPDNQTYFERARDAVVNAVGAAEQNQAVTDYLPDRTLGYFDRMGRSLREGEAIEFTTPAREAPARLTRETRRRLLLASSSVQELTEETSVRGTIPEADQDKMTFVLQMADGRRLGAPIAAQHLDTVIEAFDGYREGNRVLLQGIGRFNRQERLLGLDSVEHISILDPLDLPARLEELRSIKDGWLEGQGQAPPQGGLDWLSQAFAEHYPDDLPSPFLYPTTEGGIQAEWSLGPNEVTLEIDLRSHAGRWHALNVDTDGEESHALNLHASEDWKWLVGRIRPMTGGAA